MIRKVNKQKENQNKNNEDNIKYIEPIQPKFNPNWANATRFDRICVNVSDCTYDVVTNACKQLKFKVLKDATNPEWDLWWTDWHTLPETLMKMEHHQKINHFPGMFVLARKNLMAKNLMRMRKKNAEEYNFFPLTWNLPIQYHDFKNYFQTKPKGKARTYIVKPESLSQGKGIFLTRKLDQIDPTQRCVVQRYISKPYLINGLKFDLRIYVLVTSVDPLQVYIYNEGLARFATEQYIVPNKDNMQDICMHLTNYAINKDSNKFVFNSDENDMTTGHKRSLTSAYQTMAENGLDIPKLKDKINQIIVKTLISGLTHLKFQYKSCQADNYRSDMCFEILGFDIILNEQGQPFLLQINYTPSFSTDTPLDLNIKKNLIKDTLVLLEINKQFKERTVKYRAECKNQRMLTGKKNKFTPEQRDSKKEEALKEKKMFVDENLGGYSRIFPLSESEEFSSVYNQLIRLEGQSGVENNKKPKKTSSTLPSSHTNTSTFQRRTQKISERRLPQINQVNSSISKQNTFRHFSTNKIQSQKRVADLDLRTQSTYGRISNHRTEQKPHVKGQSNSLLDFAAQKMEKQGNQPVLKENSQKILKKLKLRETVMYAKKKAPVRQTLIPKSVQFDGNHQDGLTYCFLVGRNSKE